jgi:co-chaperonin GroES (HSP10)
MKKGRTFGNNVLIKLDEKNDSIKFASGGELYIDTTFEPEKHETVTGEVWGAPKYLRGKNWNTTVELQEGDRVVVHYLAISNAFKPESFQAVIEGNDLYVFVNYESIYAIIRDGVIIPINGYLLVEPCENPEWIRLQERMKAIGQEAVRLSTKNNTDVVYGIIRYIGKPVERYAGGKTDNGFDVKQGDTVVMRRISDIPIEFDLHAKFDSGKKYWRVQRRNILAVI